MPKLFGNNYNNIGTTENPIYRSASSGGASGSSGGFGVTHYICMCGIGIIATNSWPQTTSGNWAKRYVEYYCNFRRLDSSLPEIDLLTMLYYTTSDDQGAERTLMPVISDNPNLESSIVPEFIGASWFGEQTHYSINAPATSPNVLYQLRDTTATFISSTWGNQDFTTSFTRSQAKHYFIVNDAGTFYLQRLPSGNTAKYIYINKISEDWTPDY